MKKAIVLDRDDISDAVSEWLIRRGVLPREGMRSCLMVFTLTGITVTSPYLEEDPTPEMEPGS